MVVLFVLDDSESLLILVVLPVVVALVSTEIATAASAASVAVLVVVINGAVSVLTLVLLTLRHRGGGSLTGNRWGISGGNWLSYYLSSCLHFLLRGRMLVLVLVLMFVLMLVLVVLSLVACLTFLSKEGLSLTSRKCGDKGINV